MTLFSEGMNYCMKTMKVFMSGYILLLDREGGVYCAEDLRSLLLLTIARQRKCPPPV